MLKTITIAAALLLAAPALAQPKLRDTPAEDFKFIPQEETAKALMTPMPNQTFANDFISDHENYYVLFAKRVDHGNNAEVHDHWIDHITIMSGEGTLTYGGTLSGSRIVTPGEIRGGTFSGATVRPVKAGDFFLLPAGMPHLLSADKGKELTYLVFKAKR